MAKRPCLGCGTLTNGSRCPNCQPQRDTTTERGYGNQHQQERDRLKPIVDAGQGICQETICLKPSRWIPPGTPWDLAHDHINGGYRGPAHRGCNRSEGARRGNRQRVTQWPRSRIW
jgi:hypothetical protein